MVLVFELANRRQNNVTLAKRARVKCGGNGTQGNTDRRDNGKNKPFNTKPQLLAVELCAVLVHRCERSLHFEASTFPPSVSPVMNWRQPPTATTKENLVCNKVIAELSERSPGDGR